MTIPQQTPEQSQQTTKECAVAPLVRKDAIKKGARALQIFDAQNEYILSAGIKVYPKPIIVMMLVFTNNPVLSVMHVFYQSSILCTVLVGLQLLAANGERASI